MDDGSRMKTLVHYGDLALKGRNRSVFVRQLSDNIESATGGACEARRESIILRGGNPGNLRRVFGISWYAPYFNCPQDMENISAMCLREVGRYLEGQPGAETFAVRAKRADKSFTVKSSEMERILGEKIRLRYGLAVDIKSPCLPVHIRVEAGEARLHFGKTPGPGGLPVGTGAPLLCLLSGGIDSPVAALCLMKRGCAVDFLHFHVFPGASPVRETKMAELLASLGKYQPSHRAFFAPYKFFQERVLASFPQDEIFRGYETPLFRRFMLEVARRIAISRGYGGIITGDCIGQVASQTVENISCAYTGLDFLVISPLLGWDKDEIVKKARRAGTYEHSILPYNECCSLMSAAPRTRCRVPVMRRLAAEVGIDDLVEQTVEAVEIFTADTVTNRTVNGETVKLDRPGSAKSTVSTSNGEEGKIAAS